MKANFKINQQDEMIDFIMTNTNLDLVIGSAANGCSTLSMREGGYQIYYKHDKSNGSYALYINHGSYWGGNGGGYFDSFSDITVEATENAVSMTFSASSLGYTYICMAKTNDATFFSAYNAKSSPTWLLSKLDGSFENNITLPRPINTATLFVCQPLTTSGILQEHLLCYSGVLLMPSEKIKVNGKVYVPCDSKTLVLCE